MFLSLVGSVPRYWGGWMVSRPQRDRRVELSPVLAAMDVKPELGMGAVRFSLGRATTRNEIDLVVERLTDLLATAG
jgi:hypothetical protein